MAADPDCATCGGRGYLESENWHDVDYHDCPACAPPEPQTVTAEEYRAELRKQKQMPKEKAALDQFLRQRAWETEYRFCERRWRFDYAAPSIKVAVEYDGLYGGGAHTSVKMVAKDSEKLNRAAILGWIVIRVNAASLRDGSGYQDIERAVAIRELAQEQATPDAGAGEGRE